MADKKTDGRSQKRRPMKRTKKGRLQHPAIKADSLTPNTIKANKQTQHRASQAVESQATPENIPKSTNGSDSKTLGKSTETTRLAITRLLIAGVSDVSVIASTLNLGQRYTATQIKRIQSDVMSISIEEYRSLLNSKLVQLLHNHTTSSSTIALELHKLDCDIHNADKVLANMECDDNVEQKVIDKALGIRAKLAASRLTLLKDQRDNNATLFTTLGRVGVSQVQLNKKKEGSLPLSPNNNNSDLGASNLEVSKTVSSGSESSASIPSTVLDISDYGGMGKEVALGELSRSVKQIDRYIKGQKKGGQDGK